jgi:5-methylcytosine-specific restriction endonuclease McrBC GTP-binding regulatory subunit McrB
MNTSDRSLATLDIALRRRFDFIEMMPQEDFLKDIKIGEIELKKWFAELNKKIQVARGREFTIGHAFFAPLKKTTELKIDDLASIMQRKILPLLDEYFFEDWEGIRSVLGDTTDGGENDFVHCLNFDDKKMFKWNLLALRNPKAYTKVYSKHNATNDQAVAEQ